MKLSLDEIVAAYRAQLEGHEHCVVVTYDPAKRDGLDAQIEREAAADTLDVRTREDGTRELSFVYATRTEARRAVARLRRRLWAHPVRVRLLVL